MPLFDSVRGLKEYLLERYSEELLPAADTSFRLGYFGDGNMKFSITSEIQLGKALSLVKKKHGYFVGGPTRTQGNSTSVSYWEEKERCVSLHVQSNVMVNINIVRIDAIFI